jgi:hypothetical protein
MSPPLLAVRRSFAVANALLATPKGATPGSSHASGGPKDYEHHSFLQKNDFYPSGTCSMIVLIWSTTRATKFLSVT